MAAEKSIGGLVPDGSTKDVFNPYWGMRQSQVNLMMNQYIDNMKLVSLPSRKSSVGPEKSTTPTKET